jgi:aconitate hydratase
MNPPSRALRVDKECQVAGRRLEGDNTLAASTRIWHAEEPIMADSFGSRGTFRIGNQDYALFRLSAVQRAFPSAGRLPYCLRILLENLLRHEDGVSVRAQDIEALARWDPKAQPRTEIAFMPARVLLQDFTGVPAIVDLAAMRDAVSRLGGDPARINPLQPVELVIDHSVQVDAFGTPLALHINTDTEYQRNKERYVFLRWGQKAFRNFRVVPPETGIVHQVNLEYLARVVFADMDAKPRPLLYPDTLVGTDSHTTMINGLGVLGWGVGGIEAEAAMLGQPVSMLIPQVIGFHLSGQLREGATATDLVLTVTEILRKKGVVGKFVEFFGEGLAALPLADRATIANMAPEYGATCGIFPIDAETLRYLRLTGRPEEQVRRVEAYAKEQGLFHTAEMPAAAYSEVLHLDLATVEPSLAGPKRPQDRVPLSQMKAHWPTALEDLKSRAAKRGAAAGLPLASPDTGVATRGGGIMTPGGSAPAVPAAAPSDADAEQLQDGSVVIAAITSCTNTSNPSVMLAAGLLAKKAVERGLQVKPWVKTSLAPGSKVVTEYLRQAKLLDSLQQLKFYLVGYGCTTCIGNSGPLPAAVSKAIEDRNLVAAAVLSGNRNFEGRIHAEVRANYLASPPLVVAYALAGRVDLDLYHDPLGYDAQGKPVYLRDVWPTQQEIRQAEQAIKSELFRDIYRDVFTGDVRWRNLEAPEGDLFRWEAQSTYVKHPPYFEGMPRQPQPVADIQGARVLAYLGDSITTDHISPAGSIKKDSPAGQYLLAHGVKVEDFNSYGARRGNHEVMVRGTFANVRLRNFLAPGTEGGWTRHLPDGQQMTIYDAAMKYKEEGVPLLVLAGKEYGSGSSRDWAAKGPRLLGVRAVLAESYERIHRSNLIGMGVLPLQFEPGHSASGLGLNGEEVYDIEGLEQALGDPFTAGATVTVRVRQAGGERTFRALVRIDTPQEAQYYRHGGILPYVLRQLVGEK